MNKIFRIALMMVFFVGLGSMAHSQNRFGHIDTNELLRLMPGREAAEQELERYARELEAQFVAMQTEFQTKYQNFLENQESFSPLILQARQRELGNLQERIIDFQQSAQQDLETREAQLLRPIIQQARAAIEEVAKENGYTYIFDMSMGTILYAEPSDDIMPKVKLKLGIN